MYQIGNSFFDQHQSYAVFSNRYFGRSSHNIFLDYTLIFWSFWCYCIRVYGCSICIDRGRNNGYDRSACFLIFKRDYHWLQSIFTYQMGFKSSTQSIIRQISSIDFPIFYQCRFVVVILFWVGHLGTRSMAISNTMRNVFGLFGIIGWAMASTTNNMVSNLIARDQRGSHGFGKEGVYYQFHVCRTFYYCIKFSSGILFSFLWSGSGIYTGWYPISSHGFTGIAIHVTGSCLAQCFVRNRADQDQSVYWIYLCYNLYHLCLILWSWCTGCRWSMPGVWDFVLEHYAGRSHILFQIFFDWKARIKEVQ